MSNIVPIDQAARAVSPLMRERMAAGKSVNSNFADGIRDAFPILSIKGKVFRARISGQETPFIDPQTRQPIAFLDLVMVNASRTLAKTFYIKGFAEGDMNPPDCWSLDSVRPDPSVANKVSPVCGTCPMNAFGSRITDNGKQAKACQDARRVAVVMPHQINDPQAMVLMMRVPQSSLKNLKAYAQLLERHGMEPAGVITRIAFDYQEAFPKLLFNFVAPLVEAEYRKVIDMAEGDMVTGMLAAPDFENAPSTAPVQQTGVAGLAPQAPPVLATAPILDTAGTAPATQAAHAPAASTIIDLPDGRRFDQATGQFLAPEPEPEPVAPVLAAVPQTTIELPDGRLFDTVNKVYVERTQPQVQMPALDPTTMSLPDGKFFNTVQKAFVTGPEVGAKQVGVEEPKATRQRASRAKKPAANGEAQQQPEAAQTPVAATGSQTVNTPAEAVKETQDDGVKPVVTTASEPLNEMLAKLLTPSTVQ